MIQASNGVAERRFSYWLRFLGRDLFSFHSSRESPSVRWTEKERSLEQIFLLEKRCLMCNEVFDFWVETNPVSFSEKTAKAVMRH